MRTPRSPRLTVALVATACGWVIAATATAQTYDPKDSADTHRTANERPLQKPLATDTLSRSNQDNGGTSRDQPGTTSTRIKKKIHRAHIKVDKFANDHLKHRSKANAQSSADHAFLADRARQCDALVGQAQRVCLERQPKLTTDTR